MFRRLFSCFMPDPNPVPPPHPVPTPTPSPTASLKEDSQVKPPPTPVRTISTLESLQEKEAQLRKRIEVLETQIAQLRTTAKAYKLEGKTSHALLCLKKSKMLENSVISVNNMIMKVVEQQGALESAQTLSGTIGALSEATIATKTVMDDCNIEHVDEVMQNIQDNEDDLQEVNDRLAESTGVFAGIDDEALLAELEEELEKDGMLAEAEEADVLNNSRPELRVNAWMPAAPTHPIAIRAKSKNSPMASQNLNLESA